MLKQSKIAIAVIALTVIGSSAQAHSRPCCNLLPPCGKYYIGAFGGGGYAVSTNNTQNGTAFFPAGSAIGGPLAVSASGNTGSNSIGIAGLHAGYEWSSWDIGNAWLLAPAIEIEGYYLGETKRSTNPNPSPLLPGHIFQNTYPMYNQVYLANTVWTFNSPCLCGIRPYVGAGIGGAYVNIRGADSSQVGPPEPGVNHFNSNSSANSWTFAAQAKAGLKYAFDCHWSVFAEYRYLYLSPTSYTFGATVYPTHVPTTSWKVNFSNMQYNMGVAGIEYSI